MAPTTTRLFPRPQIPPVNRASRQAFPDRNGPGRIDAERLAVLPNRR